MTEDLYWGALKVGDWATWAGAVGSILAALAAMGAAIIALRIANQAAKREEARYARRAETHAALMFDEVVLVYRSLDRVQSLASALALAGPGNAFDVARELKATGDQLSKLIERIPINSISELPEAFAPHTAGAVSSCRMLVLEASTLLTNWREQPEDFDRLHRRGRGMEHRCLEIHTNLQPFIDFAKDAFGVEMEYD